MSISYQNLSAPSFHPPYLKYYTSEASRPQSSVFSNGYTKLDRYYTDNEEAILALISRVLNNDRLGETDEQSLKVFMDGLGHLQEYYPFVSAVVEPFKAAVPMYFKKEENEKMAAIQAQMLLTLLTLFRLRHMKTSGEKRMGGMTTESKMRALVDLIAQDFNDANSFCELYTSKDRLLRMMNSEAYEKLLKEQGNLFAQRRQDILSMFYNQIAQKEREQQQELERKVEMDTLLRKMETREEKAVREFVQQMGGPDVCLKDPKKLVVVYEKGMMKPETSDLTALGKRLSQEYSKDFDELTKKFDSFQSQLREQENHIAALLRAGAHDRIENEDMKAIWQDMSWKGSTKASHFVLALHDYFHDKMSQRRFRSWDSTGIPSEDQWTLSYINVAHVQPILEAIDDDGTGFISIKEVNDFVASKPKRWTLPQWIVYWAAGWHVGTHLYRQKIYALVQDIAELAKTVHPRNQNLVYRYLMDPTFTKLELLLRSTTPAPAAAMEDSKLMKITIPYLDYEEQILKQKLESEKYVLTSPEQISEVTGPGRIERFIYPLIYLVLKQHQRVIYLARERILDEREFKERTKALSSLFDALKQRTEGLTSIFKQSSSDVRARLGHFAFGILQSSYGDLKRDPRSNTLFTWNSRDTTDDIETDESLHSTSDRILMYGSLDTSTVSESFPAKTDHMCNCDRCYRNIIGSRFLCLRCMDENFTDNINLCSECKGEPAMNDRFSHDPSHPLLKVDDFILDGHLARLIPEARIRAQQTKDVLRWSNLPIDDIGPQHEDFSCSSCRKKIVDSCWVALKSGPDKIYHACDECYSKGIYSQNLVYVRYVEDPLSIETRLKLLGTRVENMFAFTDERVNYSESHIRDQLTNIESRLSSLEGKLEGCLNSLERLLAGQGVRRASSESYQIYFTKA